MIREDVQILVRPDRVVRLETRSSGRAEARMDPPLELLQQAVLTLERGAGDRDLLVALGSVLYEALFPPGHQEVLRQARERCVQPEDRIRLRITCRDPILAALPLEAMYDPIGRMWPATAPHLSLVRKPDVATPPVPARQRGLHVVLAAPTPSDLPQLQWQAEVSALQEALGPHLRAGTAGLTVRGGADADLNGVGQALQQTPAQVLHLVCHGVGARGDHDGGLMWTGAGGRAARISGEALAALLRGSARPRLVVLNACHSAEPPGADLQEPVEDWWLRTRGRGVAMALLEAGVPAVLAMQGRVRDEHAIHFTRGLYQALADGLGVEQAVQRARGGLHAHLLARDPASLAFCAPVLLLATAQGDLFDLSPGDAP